MWSVLILGIGFAGAQTLAPSDDALAVMLADDLHQSEIIPKMLPYLETKRSLLLRWTEHPPAGISQLNLFDGLADVFGRLKMQEAIPFLICRIDHTALYQWRNKAPDTIRERMPYVKALIRIGVPAATFLERAYSEPLTPDQRILILYTIGQIEDPSEETRLFLKRVRADTERQLEFIDQGLAGR
jgi:hypothetical protein